MENLNSPSRVEIGLGEVEYLLEQLLVDGGSEDLIKIETQGRLGRVLDNMQRDKDFEEVLMKLRAMFIYDECDGVLGKIGKVIQGSKELVEKNLGESINDYSHIERFLKLSLYMKKFIKEFNYNDVNVFQRRKIRMDMEKFLLLVENYSDFLSREIENISTTLDIGFSIPPLERFKVEDVLDEIELLSIFSGVRKGALTLSEGEGGGLSLADVSGGLTEFDS